MKTLQSPGATPLHQTVAEGFEFKAGGKSIAVKFTEQQLSAHAGSSVFWAWLHGRDWGRMLAEHLPHPPARSNNHLTAVDKALAFTHGLLCEARKLTHVAYFRRDPVVPEMLGIRRVASQSSLSRFFAGFSSAGTNLRCFRPLWRWCVERLPSRQEGYTLDLDSTRLLHEDGHQEGVKVGYALEDAIEAKMEKKGVCIQTASRTGNDRREWNYYAKNQDEFMAALNAALAGKPAFPIEIQFFDEPHWESFRALLAATK